MSFTETTRQLFNQLADAAFDNLKSGEELNLNLDAEDQTYIRFNASKIRQATAVNQKHLNLDYQANGRRLARSFDLSGNPDADSRLLKGLIGEMRSEATELPIDPYIVPMQNNGSSQGHFTETLPDLEKHLEDIIDAIGDSDFAGLFTSGPQIQATRNSKGQNHWFDTASFFIDYSLYTVNAAGENKAVKGLFAGREWHQERFRNTLQADIERLQLLKRPTHRIKPGSYRVYLAPAAVDELLGMFSWGALSYGASQKGDCALQKLVEGKATFSDKFSLSENFNLGLVPGFNSLGEVGPSHVPIIDRGRLSSLLISSRSAMEYGITGNAAEPDGESPRSPDISAGDLNESDVLKTLDTGLYLGNLHYLNWSDLPAARITGMTRYACFWVEKGEIASPIQDLRFDDTLYRIFGTELLALTRETELRVNTDTYISRSLGGSRVPGALLKDFRFTL